jgi:hypothetical protein
VNLKRLDQPTPPAVTRTPARGPRLWLLLLGLALVLLVLRWYSGGPGVEAPQSPNLGAEPEPVATPRLPQPVTPEDSVPPVLEVPVVIGKGFKPVNFQMAAVSHHTPLGVHPPAALKRWPSLNPQPLRYGALQFASGAQILLVLDTSITGYRLFADRNGNGDLTDDGPEFGNQGSGLFAATLRLPMALVSGRRDLGEEYLLWLFTSDKERPPASISYYARTQLQGEVSLPMGRFTAFLADNQPIDGNFTNDGIAIDLDRDGRIDLGNEFFPPGRPAQIGGKRYRFSVSY